MGVMSIRELNANLSKALARAEAGEVIEITKNGKPAFVVQSYQDYQFQQDTLALLKMLKLSEKSLQVAELSLDQAFE